MNFILGILKAGGAWILVVILAVTMGFNISSCISTKKAVDKEIKGIVTAYVETTSTLRTEAKTWKDSTAFYKRYALVIIQRQPKVQPATPTNPFPIKPTGTDTVVVDNRMITRAVKTIVINKSKRDYNFRSLIFSWPPVFWRSGNKVLSDTTEEINVLPPDTVFADTFDVR